MPTYKLAESAKQDVRDLVEYTVEAWSRAQAEKYYDGLIKQAQLLAEIPTLGKSYERIKDLHVFPYEKHLIYYIEQPHGITILHIVHGNKNQARHLSGKSVKGTG